MPEIAITYAKKKHSCFYNIYGEGKRNLVVYHGFGQKKEDYENLVISYPNHRIFVFDLFDHGSSSEVKKWNDLIPIYLKVFDELLIKHKLLNVSIMGFSIGCRIASIITSNRVNNIDQTFLIAPDVLPETTFFRLIMHSPLLCFFHFMVRFYWILTPVIYFLKLAFGSPFTFYFKLWSKKVYRKRLVNVWSGLKNSSDYINWAAINHKIEVTILEREDILNNDKIKMECNKLNIPVKTIALSHYEFPGKL